MNSSSCRLLLLFLQLFLLLVVDDNFALHLVDLESCPGDKLVPTVGALVLLHHFLIAFFLVKVLLVEPVGAVLGQLQDSVVDQPLLLFRPLLLQWGRAVGMGMAMVWALDSRPLTLLLHFHCRCLDFQCHLDPAFGGLLVCDFLQLSFYLI